MGIVSVKEVGEARQGEHTLDRFACRERRTFQVVTDSAIVGSLEVRLADLGTSGRIPQVGEYYGQYYTVNGYYHKGLIVNRVRANQPDGRKHPTFWIVEVEYETETENLANQQGGGSGGGGSPSTPQDANPLNRKVHVTWGQRVFLKPITKDIKNRPIINSAGSPFEIQQVEVAMRTLTVVRNVRPKDFKPLKSIQYVKTLNATDFQSWPNGCVLCERYDGNSAFENNTDYVVETIEFSFAPYDPKFKGPDPDFFRLNLVDKGPKYWDYDPEIVPPGNVALPNFSHEYHGKTGTPAEVYLDGDGTILKFPPPNSSIEAFDLDEGSLWQGGQHPDANNSYIAPATVKSVSFDIRGQSNFADFGLPENL